jgi:hypothetical protein
MISADSQALHKQSSVSTRSLWSILCEHMVPISPVHLLNITCEGEDVHVLHGANISISIVINKR